MEVYIEPLAKLIAAFTKLPGVGQRTALRYAYAIINMHKEDAAEFALAIEEAKEQIHYCSVCGNFTVNDPCDICSSRESKAICVVKEPKDVLAIEKLREYKGVYHVLHGALSPLDGVGPDDIRIKELLGRVADGSVEEVILATNSDVEGEATAIYISKLLKPLGIRVTRIAQGLPMGAELEFADDVTISRALSDRKEI
ncbi:MAG: recombination protein RecR [Clostridia bacterium]|nr:recombination protein RecR [Clostridia bacterium]